MRITRAFAAEEVIGSGGGGVDSLTKLKSPTDAESLRNIELLLDQRRFDMLHDPLTFAAPRIQTWIQRMVNAGISEFSFGSGGSMASGHYDGMKDKTESDNPHCPYDRIAGFDGRIYLPDGVDPHDRVLVEKIQRSTGLEPLQLESNLHWNRFGVSIPVTRFFFYEPISADSGTRCGFEYDICLLPRSKWLGTSDYWRFVFNKDEVQWQKEVRTNLRARGPQYRDVIETLKHSQFEECCWRIVAAYALGSWFHEAQQPPEVELPTFRHHSHAPAPIPPPALPTPYEDPPRILQPLIKSWLDGESGKEGLDRPSFKTPVKATELLIAHTPNLLRKPPQPYWVVYAAELQRVLKSRIAV